MDRRLAAILAADVVGYARLVRLDEEGTIASLRQLHALHIDPVIAARRGRIFKLMGDGMLAEFASVVDSVQAAAEIQSAVLDWNRNASDGQQLKLRIGINLGDVVIDGEDIQGDGVNVAARLEGIADPGGVYISGAVYDQVRDRTALKFEDLGKRELKNIDRPVRVWRWLGISNNGNTAAGEKRRLEPLLLPDKPSIVILPFDDLSGGNTDGHFADGFVEAITAALSRIRSFFVIARNTAYTYKGRSMNVVDVGRELGVAYALEGSVQRAGQFLRITTQLIETATGAHVWAERYDGAVDNVFELQDRITEQVAGALQPAIRAAEIERSRRKRPNDLRAYDYTIRALPHVWALEKGESVEALKLLEKARELDPDYPLAVSLTAWCHAQRSVYNWASDIAQSQAEALRLGERAAQLSSDDPLVLAVLGTVHSILRNNGTARILLERAVSLDPNSAWAWSRLGWLENYTDHSALAAQHFERALRLSPLDPMNFNSYVGLGSAYHLQDDFEQAAYFYRRGLEEKPHAYWIYRQLAPALLEAGRTEEAQAAFAKMMAHYPDLTASMVRRALVFSAPVVERFCNNLCRLGLPS